MSTSPISDTELIGKFLNKKLSKEEELLFLERKNDESFHLQLEETMVSQIGRQQLKSKLARIGSFNDTSQTSRLLPNIYKIFIATAAIVTIVFAINRLFIFNRDSLSNDQLFEAYFEVYPNIYSTKGLGDIRSKPLENAFKLYDAEQYRDAVSAFAKAEKEILSNNTTSFYYGQSLIAIGDTEKAKIELEKISIENPLYNEAQWYIALAYLKEDNVDQVIKFLSNPELRFGNEKARKIKDILAKIEKK